LRLCLDAKEIPAQVESGTNMVLITHDVHLIKSMYKNLIGAFHTAIGDAGKPS
jgi:hypothetical protein